MDFTELKTKFNLNEGQHIKVNLKDSSFEGTLVPHSNSEILMLKNLQGYNFGLKANEVKSIEILGAGKQVSKPKTIELKQNSNLPLIGILHTGGTIASRVDYQTGAVISSFNPEDLISAMPELTQICRINSKLIANMWSDDFRFAHVKLICNAIQEQVKQGVKGIIVGCGTDNLAVISACLDFALVECPIPVLLVGAQRSSDRPSTDFALNLLSAVFFITKQNFKGVAICMHESTNDVSCLILPACKTRKMHSSRRDAFKPINAKAIAQVNFEKNSITLIDFSFSRNDSKLVIKSDFEERVALFKISINMFPEQFEFYAKNNFKGLIIEGTGLGQMPGQVPNELCKIHEKFYSALKKFIDSKGIIVMTTSCLNGSVNMNVYSKGKDEIELGIISGKDMLSETAFVKLAWLLANEKSIEKIKQLMQTNLRGEINSRILENDFEK